MQERQGLTEIIRRKSIAVMLKIHFSAYCGNTEVHLKFVLIQSLISTKCLCHQYPSNISNCSAELVLEWKCCKDINVIEFTETFSYAFLLMILSEIKENKELKIFVSSILILKETSKIYREEIHGQ